MNYIIGCGGSALDALSFLTLKNVVFIDDYRAGTYEGFPIIGTTDDLIKMHIPEYAKIFNCIGSAGDNRTRNQIYEKLTKAGVKIRPLVLCSFISRNVQIGKNTLLNVNSQIHHDCIIGDNTVVSPGAIILGNVKLGNNVFVGAGSVIKQGLTINDNTVIGMGSVVIQDIPTGTWVGNPAKRMW